MEKEKPGVGIAIGQFDGGWQSVSYNFASGEMACGALFREGIERVKQGGNVDRCPL
jgi:hypothetical protein